MNKRIDIKTYAKWLRTIMAMRGTSVSYLAKGINIKPAALYRAVNETGMPSRKTREKIAAYYGVNFRYTPQHQRVEVKAIAGTRWQIEDEYGNSPTSDEIYTWNYEQRQGWAMMEEGP
jgi:transcriptional regulator with XRE-family HTH domain